MTAQELGTTEQLVVEVAIYAFVDEAGKLRAGLYCLLREPSALPLQTYKARDTWLKALGTHTPLWLTEFGVSVKPFLDCRALLQSR